MATLFCDEAAESVYVKLVTYLKELTCEKPACKQKTIIYR
jgi:hypothetical protein